MLNKTSFFLLSLTLLLQQLSFAAAPSKFQGRNNSQAVRFELVEQLTPNLGRYRYSYEVGSTVVACDAYVRNTNGSDRLTWDIARCFENNISTGAQYLCSGEGLIVEGTAQGNYHCNSGRTGAFTYSGF